MRENINKVSQRGERLDSLQDKTDNLAVSAQGFRRGANRVRKQMWWKDMKMRVCLVICVIVLLVVIIVPGKTLARGNRKTKRRKRKGENETRSITGSGPLTRSPGYSSCRKIPLNAHLHRSTNFCAFCFWKWESWEDPEMSLPGFYCR
jgi:hypothetical protein